MVGYSFTYCRLEQQVESLQTQLSTSSEVSVFVPPIPGGPPPPPPPLPVFKTPSTKLKINKSSVNPYLQSSDDPKKPNLNDLVLAEIQKGVTLRKTVTKVYQKESNDPEDPQSIFSLGFLAADVARKKQSNRRDKKSVTVDKLDLLLSEFD
jgi:hypothetical protein